MQYWTKLPVSVVSLCVTGFALLALLAMPDVVWATRLEDIAKGIAAGSSKKIQDLIGVGITAVFLIPLLTTLYLATEKKGLVRLLGIIGTIVLGTVLYMLHSA